MNNLIRTKVNSSGDEFYSLNEVDDISRNKNDPRSFPDFPYITADINAIKKIFINEILGCKNYHGFVKDGILTDKGLYIINHQLIPNALRHMCEVYGEESLKSIDDDESLREFREIFSNFKKNRYSPIPERDYISYESEFVSLIHTLYINREANNKDQLIIDTHKRSLLSIIYAETHICGKYPNIDEIISQGGNLGTNICNKLDAKGKSKVYYEERIKKRSKIIQKLLSKSTITVEDALTDIIGKRRVTLGNESENYLLTKEILKFLTDEIIKSDHISKSKIKIVNDNNAVIDKDLNDLVGKLKHKGFNVESKSRPDQQFKTLKIIGYIIDKKYPEDSIPIEFQIVNEETALEKGILSRPFYAMKQEVLNTPRHFISISDKRINKRLYLKLLDHQKSHQNDLKTIKDLKDSNNLSPQKEFFLEKRYQSVKLAYNEKQNNKEGGDKVIKKELIVNFGGEDITIDKSIVTEESESMKKLTKIFIQQLIDKGEIIPIYNIHQKETSKYYIPTHSLFTKSLSGLHKSKISKNTKVGSFHLARLIQENYDKINNVERKDGLDQEYEVLEDNIKKTGLKLLENLTAKDKYNSKIKIDNFNILFYLLHILKKELHVLEKKQGIGGIIEKKHEPYYKEGITQILNPIWKKRPE